MIRFKKKFYFFKLTEQWFHVKSVYANLWSLVNYCFLNVDDSSKPFGCVKTYSHTVTLDLNQTEEDILSGFRKKTLQNIKKSEQMGMTCLFNQDLPRFIDFYNHFALRKGIYPIPNSLADHFTDQYVTCFVQFEGETLAAHLQLFDKDAGMARGYLAGNRRFDERFDQSIVGMANKLLKKEELLYFKKMGIETYDFGGYAHNTSDKSLQGINEYKLSFGGKIVRQANFESTPYFLLKKLSSWLDRRYR